MFERGTSQMHVHGVIVRLEVSSQPASASMLANAVHLMIVHLGDQEQLCAIFHGEAHQLRAHTAYQHRTRLRRADQLPKLERNATSRVSIGEHGYLPAAGEHLGDRLVQMLEGAGLGHVHGALHGRLAAVSAHDHHVHRHRLAHRQRQRQVHLRRHGVASDESARLRRV